jgi:hypothetical protein
MKWYFSSRTKHKKILNQLIKLLKKYNQQVSFDWTLFDKLDHYQENEEKSKEIALNISKAIEDTDIFVLISDLGGTDMFVELGLAIASYLKGGKPKIYIVGAYNKRSLMHFHSTINHEDTILNVFKKEGLETALKELETLIHNL